MRRAVSHNHLRRIGETIGCHGVDAGVMVHTVPVLLCQVDHRIAVPTSVILMAITSVAGIGTKLPPRTSRGSASSRDDSAVIIG